MSRSMFDGSELFDSYRVHWEIINALATPPANTFVLREAELRSIEMKQYGIYIYIRVYANARKSG